jgi:MinD-like ATPase involved in chromosome partitioning or flagellar assembly
MEIIAFASGKGGTGKTLMASCLGYALVRAKQRVLFVDADPATDGLSLFLLGTQGTQEIGTFDETNTFVGLLRQFRATEKIDFQPRRINRSESNDLGGHGVIYEVLISGKGMYGDESANTGNPAVPDLDQATFRRAIAEFFHKLKSSSEYDYVVVDTRGGFAFESTDVCALADSFIVVTEPDFTSFYQDRNLNKRVSMSAEQIGSRPLLRSIIVNKATEGESTDGRLDLNKLEASFRLELEKEFKPLKFADTHAVPVDIEALKAYKTQRLPYLTAPASSFSFATLSAFRNIFQLVTNKWSEEQVSEWNVLIESVSKAIGEYNARILGEKEEALSRSAEIIELRKTVEIQREQVVQLKKEEVRLEESHKREIARVEGLFSSAETQTSHRERRKERLYWLAITILLTSGILFAYVESRHAQEIQAQFTSSLAQFQKQTQVTNENLGRPDFRGRPNIATSPLTVSSPITLIVSEPNRGTEDAQDLLAYSVVDIYDGSGEPELLLDRMEKRLHNKVIVGSGTSQKSIGPNSSLLLNVQGDTLLSRSQIKSLQAGRSSIYVMGIVLYNGKTNTNSYQWMYCGRSNSKIQEFIPCNIPIPWDGTGR